MGKRLNDRKFNKLLRNLGGGGWGSNKISNSSKIIEVVRSTIFS